MPLVAAVNTQNLQVFSKLLPHRMLPTRLTVLPPYYESHSSLDFSVLTEWTIEMLWIRLDEG